MMNEEGVLRSEFKAAEVKIHEEKIDLLLLLLFLIMLLLC
jgi:hypothetical protein